MVKVLAEWLMPTAMDVVLPFWACATSPRRFLLNFADAARDSRHGARDSHAGARDSHDGARDSRESARDSRDGARETRDDARDSHDGSTEPHSLLVALLLLKRRVRLAARAPAAPQAGSVHSGDTGGRDV